MTLVGSCVVYIQPAAETRLLSKSLPGYFLESGH